jgi:hypothetical protein
MWHYSILIECAYKEGAALCPARIGPFYPKQQAKGNRSVFHNTGGMMRTIQIEPGTQISGATVLSLVENMTAADFAPLISKYGFDAIDPDKWYPLQDYLDFVADAVENRGLAFNLVAIGMSIAEVAIMPPELANASFPQMVMGWDDHYQANFRNGDVGRKTTIKVADQHYKIVHDQTVVPDDIEYGVLYGFAQRFLPPDTLFDVWFDEDVPRMDEGGDQTILHVSWD